MGGSFAIVSFGSNDLVIEGTKIKPKRSPRLEMIGSRHSSARALGLADRYVLVKRCSTDNGRCVHALVQVNVVDRSVRGDSSFFGAESISQIG